MTTFQELGLSSPVMKSVSDMGFEETTPIQSEAIPLALAGEDIIGQAQTGTGKTAAFGIPMVEKFTVNATHIQGIVVAPTRELAVQVAEELNRIGQYKGIRALPIYGGQDISRQIRALKKYPHIIVGTPGRLMDHMRRKTIRLQNVKIAVLDEADEMLNMGFIEDIEEILKDIPTDRQTLLFSATMPRPVQILAEKFMRDAKILRIKPKDVTVPFIEQKYVEVVERQKFDTLTRLLDIQSPNMTIVFARTKRRVDELSEALNKRGYSVEGIHGDMTQGKRDSVMGQFKKGDIEVLVATDVASRGLDISGVTHIYNFDIPQDQESYVHRIGRTGRAGKTGMAITFVAPREIYHFKTIERHVKKKIARLPVPSMSEAIEGQQQMTVKKLLEVIEKEDISLYKNLAESLLNDTDSITLLAGALKILTKEPDTTPVHLKDEAPSFRRKDPQPKPKYKEQSQGYQRRKSKYQGSGGKRKKF